MDISMADVHGGAFAHIQYTGCYRFSQPQLSMAHTERQSFPTMLYNWARGKPEAMRQMGLVFGTWTPNVPRSIEFAQKTLEDPRLKSKVLEYYQKYLTKVFLPVEESHDSFDEQVLPK